MGTVIDTVSEITHLSGVSLPICFIFSSTFHFYLQVFFKDFSYHVYCAESPDGREWEEIWVAVISDIDIDFERHDHTQKHDVISILSRNMSLSISTDFSIDSDWNFYQQWLNSLSEATDFSFSIATGSSLNIDWFLTK